MSGVREALFAQLACFDEDAFVALANRGLLRRAQKDLEKQQAQILEDTSQFLLVGFGEQTIRFDVRGPAHATCSCPAAGVCQHILAAAITLQRMGDASATEMPGNASTKNAPSISNDTKGEISADTSASVQEDGALSELNAALLALPHSDLVKHAGRAGYRWAWQFVQDLDLERDLTLGGERNIVIGFRHPRITLRYMGGGVGSLVVDVDSTQSAKQQVAAVLAYRRAHGMENPPPEATAKEKSTALDLGKDHALLDSAADSQQTSRARLRDSVATLLQDCVVLGLSHLSQSIHERFSTIAVWAQGAEYYRLGLLLRRIADHVESLLERTGGADEHRLLDEMALCYGLVGALAAAEASGISPKHLVGRARSRYEEVGTIELLGLGAQAWRTPSGYVGLTMLFWSQQDKRFYACTDARPELQRGFNPVARYKAPGPWSGLGAPSMTSGRLVRLTNAQINDQGRLSAAEGTAASVQIVDGFAQRLAPYSIWSDIVESRTQARRSLLAEADPMSDWVVLAPTRWGEARFDANRQVLIWPLFDKAGACLDLELAFSEYTEHAIRRIEQLSADRFPINNFLVARIRTTASGLVGEPMSIVRGGPAANENPIDALFFDPAPESSSVSRWISKFRAKGGQTASDEPMAAALDRSRYNALWDLKQWLRRQAERGVPEDRVAPLRRELAVKTDRLAACGFAPLATPMETERSFPAWVIQANYICMQYERLTNDTADASLEDN